VRTLWPLSNVAHLRQRCVPLCAVSLFCVSRCLTAKHRAHIVKKCRDCGVGLPIVCEAICFVHADFASDKCVPPANGLRRRERCRSAIDDRSIFETALNGCGSEGIPLTQRRISGGQLALTPQCGPSCVGSTVTELADNPRAFTLDCQAAARVFRRRAVGVVRRLGQTRQSYRFSHKSIMEYFAAQHVVAQVADCRATALCRSAPDNVIVTVAIGLSLSSRTRPWRGPMCRLLTELRVFYVFLAQLLMRKRLSRASSALIRYIAAGTHRAYSTLEALARMRRAILSRGLWMGLPRRDGHHPGRAVASGEMFLFPWRWWLWH